jgi:DNA-binding transcriptional ArsR family regulator
VEIELDELDDGTRVRVTESRPLAILDGRDLAIELGGGSGLELVFAALSDGTRRSLYSLLGERGEASATDLARALPVSRQAVQKHLGTLSGAGLVATRRAGREVLYRPTPGPMSEALEWMAEVGAQWDDRLAALDQQLARGRSLSP